MRAAGGERAGEAGGGSIVLGFARGPDGERVPVTAEPDSLIRHAAVIGASGGGKTAWMLGVLVQLLRENPRRPIIVVDPKNDLAHGLTTFLAALTTALPPDECKALIDGFRLVAPFRDASLELNMLRKVQGVESELQALAVMDALQAALDDDLAGFARISSVLQVTLTAAIEAGLKLTELPRLLLDADFRRSIELRLPPGRTREMLGTRPKATAASSIAALVARLDRILASALVRRLVAADGCFEFRDRLDAGITLVDNRSPPKGARALQKLFGSWFVQQLSSALLSRSVNDGTPHLLVVIDELPEVVSGRAAEDVGRLLALVRYKKVGLTLLFQDENQLVRAPELLALIKANAARLTFFRGNPQSLRWIEPFLPRPVLNAASPLQKPPAGAADAIARQLLMRMGDLENRVCLHIDRAAGEQGAFMATPYYDMADIERRARSAPPSVRDALLGRRRGTEVPSTPRVPDAAPASAPAVNPDRPAPDDGVENAKARAHHGQTAPSDAKRRESANDRVTGSTAAPEFHRDAATIPGVMGWVPWAPPPGGAP